MNRLESLTAQKETYTSELISLEKSITEAAQKHFEESGGCQRCRGRGWVVTWDTLDSMTRMLSRAHFVHRRGLHS